MSHNKIAFLITCGALACQGQGPNTATIRGVTVRFEWKAEPSNRDFENSGGGVLVTKDHVVKRHIGFFNSRKYFGYDLAAEPLADGRCRLTFSGLSLAPETMTQLFKGQWTLVPLPRQPFTQIVSAGDVIALDLFVNPGTGQKIVDYLRIALSPIAKAAADQPARDFGVDDVEWTVESPKVSVNAALVDQAGSTIVGSSPQWIYLKGHGRFVFSLKPRGELGFKKAGEIRGSHITWAAQGNRYALEGARNVVPGEGVFNLYVFHSPRYRPSHETNFEFGAGGTFESLIRR